VEEVRADTNVRRGAHRDGRVVNGGRLAAEVGGVLLREVSPFFGQVVGGEDGRNGAGRDTGAAVDALHRIDVKLLFIRVVGFVLLRVDAINRARIYASGVLRADTRFCNDVCHL